MLLGRKGVTALRAVAMMLDVILLILAIGHFVERKIRNFGECLGKLLVSLFFRRFLCRHRFFQRGDFVEQRLHLCVVLILLRLADFLRRRVAACLRGFEREDFRAALLVERDQPFRLRFEPAPRQRAIEGVGIVADEANVVHWDRSLRVMAGLVPAIHVFVGSSLKTWMPGTSPGMTNNNPDNTP